jgi:hypothetical protein
VRNTPSHRQIQLFVSEFRVMLQEVEGDRQWGFRNSAQCFEFIQQQLHKERKEGDLP